jgi:hypothetical protein
VDEERHDALALAPVLLGAHAPLDYRVHELEVARVEGEREVDALSRPGDAVGGVPRWYFTSPPPRKRSGFLSSERGEDLAGGLVHDVDEDVEAPAVGHADDDLVDAVSPA